ncbi:MAG: primosomal protein N' [bacterium]
MNKKFANVVFPIAVDKEFQYEIPESIGYRIEVGMRVSVPFGRRKSIGYVVSITDKAVYKNLKAISRLLDNFPVFDEKMLEFTKWISRYYFCSWGMVLETALPPGMKKEVISRKKQRIVSVAKPQKTICSDIDSKKIKSAKQIKVLKILLSAKGLCMECKALCNIAGVTEAVVKSLKKNEYVGVSHKIFYRDPFAKETVMNTQHLSLTSEQGRVFNKVINSIKKGGFNTFLLHGITGSGKTEIYLQAIDFCIKNKKQAIVLVPEISLASQIIQIFKSRFGDRVAILHSRLSKGERYDEWEKIKRGKVDIVVGARSAIFAPFANPGLIIVDESHEPAYKQGEAPRYNGRDVAIMRGKLANITVLLGTATPSLETYYNIEAGKYELIELKERIDKRKLPDVRIVDMQDRNVKIPESQVFSKPLLLAIKDKLSKKEQIILFLNRRGFSTYIMCYKCGYVARCPECNVSLVYHSQQDKVRCHYCNFEDKPPNICPECQAFYVKYSGYGTEKVEEEISNLFPHAKYQRMDTDTTTRKNSHQGILRGFKHHEFDILIGTQMIAKGLDFPKVTLVGVISADTSLFFPDFRSGERTFQLLTQIAGRSGRGPVPGEVIIQTYNPNHFSIIASSTYNYNDFYKKEMLFRKGLNYPPFKHIVLITVKGHDSAKVVRVSNGLVFLLKKELSGQDCKLLGPAPAPMAKIKNQYRWHILIKHKMPGKINMFIERSMKGLKNSKLQMGKTNIIVDIDPMNTL